MSDDPKLPEWIPFECDGRELEYQVVLTQSKERPPGWPSHQASPGTWEPKVILAIRSRGDVRGGFGYVYPAGVTPTLDDAIDVAHRFREHIP